jgi:hypothetical protein
MRGNPYDGDVWRAELWQDILGFAFDRFQGLLVIFKCSRLCNSLSENISQAALSTSTIHPRAFGAFGGIRGTDALSLLRKDKGNTTRLVFRWLDYLNSLLFVSLN